MIDSAVLDAMVASGCTAEQIAAAVKASCAAAKVEAKCFVYRLVDPRNGRTFYVGIACDPIRRLRNHATDPSSAAYLMLLSIRASGFEINDLLEIESEHQTRVEALEAEAELIRTMSGLVNRAGVSR